MLIAAAVLWSVSGIAVKLATRTTLDGTRQPMDPFAFALYRSLFAAVAVAPMLPFGRGALPKLLPMTASDTYLRGRGRMLGKLAGMITVADGSGTEYDVSELVTWLNDTVLLAPSMLLCPAVSWAQVSDDAFDVTLSDAGHTVTARVFLDERGAPMEFAAERYATLPGGLVLARWRTPVHSWSTVNGRPFPGPTEVVYDLPDGPFCYLEGGFVPASIAYNLPPGP